MQVDINKTISYDVAKVEILGVNIGKETSGASIYVVPYRWLAADGSVIRQNTGRYTDTELIAALGGTEEAKATIALIATLFPEGDRPAISIRIMGTEIQVFASHTEIVDGKQKPIIVKYSDAELAAKGVTTAMITAVIQQLAVALV